MSKRIFLLVSLVIIATMILTACGPKPYECTDTLGCVTVAPDEPVHIAYAMVISGSDATLGIDSRNGAEIAVDDRGGKVLDHAIKFDGED
jgi:branched-chain amino acid transport system substrate-binding protein